MFVLHGNGSDGSKDLEVEKEEDDEEAMIAASVGEKFNLELEAVSLEIEI